MNRSRTCPATSAGFCLRDCKSGEECSITFECRATVEPVGGQKHSHYFKECPFDSIDVYRVLSLFSVTDPCLQHAAKKLLVAGGRGHKDIAKDVQDAIDTLERWKAMRAEELSA
jgi:hypothetical protein